MIFEWEFFGTYLCYVRSYKLITNNKRFNVRGNICRSIFIAYSTSHGNLFQSCVSTCYFLRNLIM